MDGVAKDVANHAEDARKTEFDKVVDGARLDLVRAVLTKSHEEAYEAAERQAGEEDDKAAAIVKYVYKVTADNLENAFIEELEQRYNQGELSRVDAQYYLMAYQIGLSVAADQNVVEVGSAVHGLVDEETGSSTEKLYWKHAFHAKRFDQASVPPLFDRDVHDAIMGMVAIRRKRLISRPGHQWDPVDELARQDGIGLFTIHDQIDMSSGSTVLLRRADDGAGTATVVVAVAASKSPWDFARDGDVALDKPPESLQLPAGALVHSGFGKIAAQLVTRGAIFHAIDSHRRSGQTLHVVWTGHSLGGAVATLLAAAFVCRNSARARAIAEAAAGHVDGGDGSANTDHDPVARSRLVTMGAPRVGNPAAQAVVKALTTLTTLVADGDPVPLWPTHTSIARRSVATASRAAASVVRLIPRVPVWEPATLPTYTPVFTDEHIVLHRKPARLEIVIGGATTPPDRPNLAMSTFGFVRYHKLLHYLAIIVNLYDGEVEPTEEAATD